MFIPAQFRYKLALALCMVLMEQYLVTKHVAAAFVDSRHMVRHLRSAHETESWATHANLAAVKDGAEVTEKVYAISDLHTDNVANLNWLIEKCTAGENSPGPSDALIVAGDISHDLALLEKTLSIIQKQLGCTVFFVSGNHEAWIGGKEMDEIGFTSSLQKLGAVRDVCRKLGVHTSNQLLGSNQISPVWVAPIDSWYDGTLTLPGCEDLTKDFGRWPWVDFARCEWGAFRPDASGGNGKIPVGITEHILEKNDVSINQITSEYNDWNEDEKSPPGLISFSHFLPNQRTLPDWKDPQSEIFLREEWLDHPVPEVSAKFSKVAGSKLIDEQIRSIVPSSKSMARHLHVFGHSHRPKDFSFRGIRYIHNPLGKPIEREMNMVPKDVDFQLIWDTTTEAGEVSSDQIIRYWEERGGGLNLLEENMRKNRWHRRGKMKREPTKSSGKEDS